jgi:uncharacterized protein YabE (DUF348 family)
MAKVASTVLESELNILLERVLKICLLVQGDDKEVTETFTQVEGHLLAQKVENTFMSDD